MAVAEVMFETRDGGLMLQVVMGGPTPITEDSIIELVGQCFEILPENFKVLKDGYEFKQVSEECTYHLRYPTENHAHYTVRLRWHNTLVKMPAAKVLFENRDGGLMLLAVTDGPAPTEDRIIELVG
ncbi:hypothetical protein Ancab_030472 [Ancistrocladus abbreviatus]